MAENIINKNLRTHGNVFNDLYANSPSRTDYNVGVNADLANRVSQGLGSIPGIGPALSAVADVAMPAGAFALSPAYDTLQGIARSGKTFREARTPYSGIIDDTEVPAGPTLGQIGQAIANEKIGQTMFERMVGASAPLANRISNFNAPSIMGTAQAAEVNIPNTISAPFNSPGAIITDREGKYEINPDGKTASLIGRANMSDIAGLGDLGNPTGDSRVVSEEMGMTGTPNFGRPSMADIAGQVNENLIDRGNPFNDSRVVSEEQGLSGGIPDRGRGMPGTMGAFEMIGGTPVAIGDVLGRQQALEKADFVEEIPQGINYDALGILGTLGGLLTGSTALKGLGMFGNYKSGRTGKALGAARRGLGSLGSKFAGAMRGINPTTGRPNTQAQYEKNRSDRQIQGRIDNMLERKAKGKTYSEKNLSDLIGKQIAGREDKSGKGKTSGGFTNPGKNSYGPHQGSNDGGGSGGSSKIVCTMMNERYGFGFFRNKIWMKFHEGYSKDYIKGYHAIFLPLVKIAKGEGKINTAVRKVLEHMGRHVTADMFKIMKGKKRDTLGRIYRAIFEPVCHIIGKIKSALRRG